MCHVLQICFAARLPMPRSVALRSVYLATRLGRRDDRGMKKIILSVLLFGLIHTHFEQRVAHADNVPVADDAGTVDRAPRLGPEGPAAIDAAPSSPSTEVTAMKLTDLEPQFIQHEETVGTWTRRLPDGATEEVTGPQSYIAYVDHLSEAHGVMFLCPKCFAANGGDVGTHQIICWNPSVPQTVEPKPGRWEMRGTGYGDLSLVAGSSSVLLTSGCQAHFFVTTGEIRVT